MCCSSDRELSMVYFRSFIQALGSTSEVSGSSFSSTCIPSTTVILRYRRQPHKAEPCIISSLVSWHRLHTILLFKTKFYFSRLWSLIQIIRSFCDQISSGLWIGKCDGKLMILYQTKTELKLKARIFCLVNLTYVTPECSSTSFIHFVYLPLVHTPRNLVKIPCINQPRQQT